MNTVKNLYLVVVLFSRNWRSRKKQQHQNKKKTEKTTKKQTIKIKEKNNKLAETIFPIHIASTVNFLKFRTLYSILFWLNFCFFCISFFKYLVEWQTV